VEAVVAGAGGYDLLVEMTSPRVVTATFTLNQHTVSVAADPPAWGAVTGGGTYGYGSVVTMTASPGEGYYFRNWTEDGLEVSKAATYAFTLRWDRSFTANFTEEFVPSPTPTAAPTVGATATPGATPTPGLTATPEVTPTPVSSQTPGATPGITPSATPTPDDPIDPAIVDQVYLPQLGRP
jgi:hypothetical protein